MSVACIIPAYNEQQTIESVVRCAVYHPLITEVIVVDDGSTDRTAQVAADAGARVVSNSRNTGKGQTMERGVAQSSASTILFLDADLKGLTPDHLTQLIQPVISGACAMTIAIRDRGPIVSALNRWIGPWVAGERCLTRGLWEHTPSKYKQGFMIELALNHVASTRRCRIKLVGLSGLSIRRKEQKMGLLRGLWARAQMILQMLMVLIKLHIFS